MAITLGLDPILPSEYHIYNYIVNFIDTNRTTNCFWIFFSFRIEKKKERDRGKGTERERDREEETE